MGKREAPRPRFIELPQRVRMAVSKQRDAYARAREAANKVWLRQVWLQMMRPYDRDALRENKREYWAKAQVRNEARERQRLATQAEISRGAKMLEGDYASITYAKHQLIDAQDRATRLEQEKDECHHALQRIATAIGLTSYVLPEDVAAAVEAYAVLVHLQDARG